MTSKLDALNLTPDEIERFSHAMKDDKFRELLRDYAEEISNPANHAEYEAYLRQLETDGSSPPGTKLLSPTPVQCIKFMVDNKNKYFINLCTCDALQPGTSIEALQNDVKGKKISLPYSLSEHREFKDNKGASCRVYDFVFSPVTWSSYSQSPRLHMFLIEIAMQSIVDKEQLTLRVEAAIKHSVIMHNVLYKGGKPPPKLFRTDEQSGSAASSAASKPSSVKESKSDKSEEKTAPSKAQSQSIIKPRSSAAAATTLSSSTNNNAAAQPIVMTAPTTPADLQQVSVSRVAAAAAPQQTGPTQPNYTIVQRGYFDFQKAALPVGDDAEFGAQSRPKELVLKIELPLVARVTELAVDISSSGVSLRSDKYALDTKLPFAIVDAQAHAAFSAKTHTLTLTLPVAPPSDDEVQKWKAQVQAIKTERERRRKEVEERERMEQEERERNDREEREKLDRQQAEQEKERQLQSEAEQRDKAAATSADAASSNSPSSQSAPHPSSSPTLPPALVTNRSPSFSSVKKHVSFDFQNLENGDRDIPERENGPKPVGLLADRLAREQEQARLEKKKHKKKHVAGSDGGDEWTGVGLEPPRSLLEQFPPPTISPLSPMASSTSPLHSGRGRSGSGGGGASGKNTMHFPPFTYSQSAVSVVLVIKVASAENLRVDFQSRSVDIYFTSSPKSYRLYLPLAADINKEKCHYDLGKKNIQVHLIKVAPVEWTSLADYSAFGYNSDTTPLNSPCLSSLSPRVGSDAALIQEIDEIDSIGGAMSSTADASDANRYLSNEPIALQPLPTPAASSVLAPLMQHAQVTPAQNVTHNIAQSQNHLFQLD